MSFPKVYIVVLNYNGWRDTIECLESLYKLSYSNYQIVVVDNCSTDNSLHYIKKWVEGSEAVALEDTNSLRYLSYPSIQKPLPYEIYEADNVNGIKNVCVEDTLILISTRANLGYAGGNNAGLKFVLNTGDADYVWLLNNDTVVEPDSLSYLVDYYQSVASERVGLLGCKIKYYHCPTIIQCIAGSYYNKWLGYSKQIGNNQVDNGQFDDEYVCPDLINGACVLVSISFLKTVGLLNEEYFLYFEEQDWAWRAQLNGFALAFCHKAVIYHKEGSTIGGGQWRGNSRFSDFYFSRSKLLFTKRYFSQFTLILVKLSFIFTILNRIRRKQFNRIPMILKIIADPYKSRFYEND